MPTAGTFGIGGNGSGFQKAVLAVEAAGMEVAEPDIRAVLVVDQVMSTLLSLLQIIQMVVYLTLLIIFLMLKLLPEINRSLLLLVLQKLVILVMDM